MSRARKNGDYASASRAGRTGIKRIEGIYTAVIGTLTVDLVANTASFSGDMGKAAASAEDFGKKASAAGQQVEYSMSEAKGGMMLMSEELGVHIPRHLQTLIAEIPAVGAAFGSMLPLVGVIAAIAIIEKLVAKNQEAKEKLAQGWDKFGAETLTVFDDLDDQMLKVGKTADELAGRHLAALAKELELIDHASLRELAQEFGKLEKSAHGLMLEMKSSWYEILSGSQGADNALSQFTNRYDIFLAKKDTKGAFDLLVGTLDAAQKHLAEMERLEKLGYVASQKNWQSQRLFVDILKDQLKVTQDIADVTEGKKANVKTGEAQAEAGRQDAVYNEQQKGLENRRRAEERYSKEQTKLHEKAAKDEERIAEEQAKATEAIAAGEMKVQEGLARESLKDSEAMAKLTAASEIEAAHHRVAMRQATAQEAAAVEVKAAQTMTKTETAALDQEIASLDKHDAEYLVKLKQFEDKKAQVIRQGALEATKITDKAEEEKLKRITDAEGKVSAVFAHTTAQSIVQGHSMAQAFTQLGKQMEAAALDNLLQMETIAGRQKLIKAKTSAVDAYTSVMDHVPFPAAQVLAPIAAGAAFAGVMAFEHGGKIPGGLGAVPIVGHAGETVVTKALTDRVEASEGRRQRPSTIQFHIHGIKDADGFKASQTQIAAKAHHAAEVAAAKNR
jgi:hypothetical protein